MYIYIYDNIVSSYTSQNHRSVGMPIHYMDSMVAMLPGKLWFPISSPVNRRRLDEGIDSV